MKEKDYPHNEQDLMGIWQLFINPIAIQKASVYTGLRTYNGMNLSDSILNGMIRQITFVEADLADIVYMDGRDKKGFMRWMG